MPATRALADLVLEVLSRDQVIEADDPFPAARPFSGVTKIDQPRPSATDAVGSV
jgi:hypothetical protein